MYNTDKYDNKKVYYKSGNLKCDLSPTTDLLLKIHSTKM